MVSIMGKSYNEIVKKAIVKKGGRTSAALRIERWVEKTGSI